MFSLPPLLERGRCTASGSRGDASSRDSSVRRSRSPRRSEQAVSSGARWPGGLDVPWSTGNRLADQWIKDHDVDPLVLDNLAELPQAQRLRLVNSTIKKTLPHQLPGSLPASEIIARNRKSMRCSTRPASTAGTEAGNDHGHAARGDGSSPCPTMIEHEMILCVLVLLSRMVTSVRLRKQWQ